MVAVHAQASSSIQKATSRLPSGFTGNGGSAPVALLHARANGAPEIAPEPPLEEFLAGIEAPLGELLGGKRVPPALFLGDQLPRAKSSSSTFSPTAIAPLAVTTPLWVW